MKNGLDRWLARSLCCAALLLGACGDDDGEADSPDGGASGSGGNGSGDAGPMGLPSNTAGKACSDDADCGGGMCAAQVTGIGLGAMPISAPGGYCTATCMTDVECGAGGACVLTLGATIAGQCFATCASMGDCRDGYQCGGGFMLAGVVVPDTCRPTPDTDQLEDDVAGDACMEAADCPGGTCLKSRMELVSTVELPGGYCSGRCLEDAHCGAGGVCLPALLSGAGSCYQSCADDADCTRDGYRCRALRGGLRGCNPAADPLPDDTTGDACAGDADCGGAAGTCQTELPVSGFGGAFGQTVPAPGGYCSQPCEEHIDCGAGGMCSGGPLGGGYCFKPCAAMTDCRDGYVCDERGSGIPGAGQGAADGGTPDGGAGASNTFCVPEPPPPDEEDAGAG